MALGKKTEKPEEQMGWKENCVLYLHDVIYMLTVILIVFLLIFRVNVVSGSSMRTTLVDGDYLLLFGNLLYREPEYGDIVDGRIVRRYEERPIIAPPPHVIRYSKLKLIVASKAAGKWEAFKAFIASAGYEDEWQACQFLSSGYEQFEQAKAAIIAAGIATAEEIEAILAASVDEEVGV